MMKLFKKPSKNEMVDELPVNLSPAVSAVLRGILQFWQWKTKNSALPNRVCGPERQEAARSKGPTNRILSSILPRRRGKGRS
eukprot:1276491-Rhodomonas_salina.2